MGYETFDHTADIGIRAWGKEAEVFEEAAKALFSVIVDLRTVSPKEKLTLQLKASNREELFLKWLKELLFIFDSKHVVLNGFKVFDLKPESLSAEVFGEPLDVNKHAMSHEVKAITRHQFKWTQEQDRYLAEIILDI